uniref:monofunctional biosynthetic peptidoglycan transglycosylase n=1 Tax=Flavobacterium sp. TaxID=239 RepID=UPI00404ACDBC
MPRRIFRFVGKSLLWFFVISILWVIIYRFVPVPFTPLMGIRVFEQKMEGKEAVMSHDWVPLSEISTHLQKAVIASEDQKFLTHHGFDVEAIQKAREANAKGKKLRGGSTISQQTAKNVFLWPGRSYFRKGMEAYFTVLIEFFWSKERIMEVYLNSIEMGDGVYGAHEAARVWYRKKPSQLNAREAAGIAAILPNPRSYRASNSSSYINRRKNAIERQMRNLGPLKWD